MTQRYRSDAFAAIHETAEALHDIGAIDKRTMSDFNEACLTPLPPMAPGGNQAARARAHSPQPVGSSDLGVSSKTG
jgi:putative transcriptional regulator